jgi:hypothetical protein
VAFINYFNIQNLFLLNFGIIFCLLLAKIVFSSSFLPKIMAFYVLITNFIVVFIVVNQQLLSKHFTIILLFSLFNFMVLLVANKNIKPI